LNDDEESAVGEIEIEIEIKFNDDSGSVVSELKN
jgi:hypothetical protein